MYRQISGLHISILDCRNSLADLDMHLNALAALGEGGEHLLAEAVNVISSAAFRIRAQRRYWALMHAGVKTLLPNPGPHRTVMRIADALVHAIGFSAADDDALIFQQTAQRWQEIRIQYHADLVASHLQLPSADVLTHIWVEIQAQAFSSALTLANKKKAEAIAAANAALGHPEDLFLEPKAGYAKREFLLAADRAICLARTVDEIGSVEALFKVGYPPLDQVQQ